jgi:hypothetical protein
VILSIITTLAFALYTNLNHVVSNSVNRFDSKEVYLINARNGSQRSICLSKQANPEELFSDLILINNSSDPIYIQNAFRLRLSVYSNHFITDKELQFEQIQLRDLNSTYRKIEGNAISEMSFRAKIDSCLISDYLGSHEKDVTYEILFSVLKNGSVSNINQRFKLDCNSSTDDSNDCNCY